MKRERINEKQREKDEMRQSRTSQNEWQRKNYAHTVNAIHCTQGQHLHE